MSGTKVPISVVIIALNAARQIEACLASVKFADDVLVVDSGSTDATRAIADVAGARVLEKEWLGFGRQKQFAVGEAKHDWVLCIDVDERVSPELAHSITRAMREPDHMAYRMPRRNRFLGRWLRHGEGYPDWSLRLFDRRVAHWSSDPVHEKVICAEPVGDLAGDLLHESAETVEGYLAKQNRYTSLAALAFNGKPVSAVRLVLSPLLRFTKFYVVRGGFRDGVPGLVHITIGCFNSFIKYAKILERQGRGRDQ